MTFVKKKKKNSIKELCKKSFENFLNYVEFRIHTEKKSSLQNSTNQTFIFMSSKVVYFNKHLASTAPETKSHII